MNITRLKSPLDIPSSNTILGRGHQLGNFLRIKTDVNDVTFLVLLHRPGRIIRDVLAARQIIRIHSSNGCPANPKFDYSTVA
eukprot:g18647.t1